MKHAWVPAPMRVYHVWDPWYNPSLIPISPFYSRFDGLISIVPRRWFLIVSVVFTALLYQTQPRHFWGGQSPPDKGAHADRCPTPTAEVQNHAYAGMYILLCTHTHIFIYTYAHLSIYLSVCLSYSVCLSVYLSYSILFYSILFYSILSILSFNLSIYLSIYLSFYLSIYLCTCTRTCTFIRICKCKCLYVYVSMCIYIYTYMMYIWLFLNIGGSPTLVSPRIPPSGPTFHYGHELGSVSGKRLAASRSDPKWGAFGDHWFRRWMRTGYPHDLGHLYIYIYSYNIAIMVHYFNGMMLETQSIVLTGA